MVIYQIQQSSDTSHLLYSQVKGLFTPSWWPKWSNTPLPELRSHIRAAEQPSTSWWSGMALHNHTSIQLGSSTSSSAPPHLATFKWQTSQFCCLVVVALTLSWGSCPTWAGAAPSAAWWTLARVQLLLIHKILCMYILAYRLHGCSRKEHLHHHGYLSSK